MNTNNLITRINRHFALSSFHLMSVKINSQIAPLTNPTCLEWISAQGDSQRQSKEIPRTLVSLTLHLIQPPQAVEI